MGTDCSQVARKLGGGRRDCGFLIGLLSRNQSRHGRAASTKRRMSAREAAGALGEMAGDGTVAAARRRAVSWHAAKWAANTAGNSDAGACWAQ